MKKIFNMLLCAVFFLSFGFSGYTSKRKISREIIKQNKKNFAKEGRKNIKDVGTWIQTDVADQIIRMFERLRVLRSEKALLKIVEVGAGCGEVTLHLIEHICQKKYKNISIDAIELSPVYEKMLCQGCKKLKEHYGDAYPDVKTYSGDFLKWKSRFEAYDYMISTVPFNSFEVGLVQQFLKKYEALVPRGMVSYVEYMCFGWLKKIGLYCAQCWKPREYENFEQRRAILQDFRKKHRGVVEKKLKHIPPITIYHMVMG